MEIIDSVFHFDRQSCTEEKKGRNKQDYTETYPRGYETWTHYQKRLEIASS